MATVLIVDDRAVNRDLVCTVLGYHGHETIEAQSGPHALSILAERRPDLLIVDVLMPEMDGYQLARAIRADPALRDLPVLFYTANYVEAEIGPIAASVGVDRIVSKSGDLTELLDAIADTLGTTPVASEVFADDEADREHLRVVNAKLIEKIEQLEEAARLHQMVDAVVVFGDDLSRPAMLHRIATAAHALVPASHTALLTVGAEGQPPECVHVGNDSPRRVDVEAITNLDELRASGYLIVPIGTREEQFGHLLLLPRANVEFGDGDRSLLDTLARAAGVAIANSQLYGDARRRQAWLAASADVASTLLNADLATAYGLLAGGARRVLGAQVCWVEFVEGDDLVIVTSDGPLSAVLPSRLPRDRAVLFDDISTTGQPIVMDDASADARLRELLIRTDVEIGPLLGVPLTASGRNFGVLHMGNERGGPQFTPLDVEMARAFAGRAAQTLEFAQAEGDRHRLSVLEDRNRIARDLHDVVIQRLYGLGLRMERVLGQLPEQIAAQLADINTDLDETIDEIRNTVFSLQVPNEGRADLHADVVHTVQQSAELLGFLPRLNIFGALDTDVAEPVAAHLLATLSEALSNVVRHAAATDVDVLIRTTRSELTLRVADNGRGIPSHPHESGLSNLRRRAVELGGAMRVEPGQIDSGGEMNEDDGHRPGTVLSWTVPLAAAAARPRFLHATAEPAQRTASVG